jgi:hypothetical protein
MSDDDKTRILSGRADDDKTRVLSGAGAADDARTRVLKAADLVRAAAEAEDDIPTRILSREAAAALAAGGAASQPAHMVAPQGTPGDRIVFQCPNGHRIVVGKQFAGKRGKCNKCGANVQIPRLTVGSADDPFAAIADPAQEAAQEFVVSGGASAPEDDEPPALDGLPFGDLGAGDAASGEEGADGIGGSTEEDGGEADWNFDAGDNSRSIADDNASPWGGVDAAPSFDTGDGNPTARLVAKLWMEREHGGIIEVHLVGGSVLLPEWYDSKWSRGTHGLFASPAADGSVTITAVAWENVERVIVRQLAAVPDDMFA